MTVFALFAVAGFMTPIRAMCSAWIAERYLVTNQINNENYEGIY